MKINLKTRIENRVRKYLVDHNMINIGETAEGYAVIFQNGAFAIVDPATGKIVITIQ